MGVISASFNNLNVSATHKLDTLSEENRTERLRQELQVYQYL